MRLRQFRQTVSRGSCQLQIGEISRASRSLVEWGWQVASAKWTELATNKRENERTTEDEPRTIIIEIIIIIIIINANGLICISTSRIERRRWHVKSVDCTSETMQPFVNCFTIASCRRQREHCTLQINLRITFISLAIGPQHEAGD